jgi:hypothetical protein
LLLRHELTRKLVLLRNELTKSWLLHRRIHLMSQFHLGCLLLWRLAPILRNLSENNYRLMAINLKTYGFVGPNSVPKKLIFERYCQVLFFESSDFVILT